MSLTIGGMMLGWLKSNGHSQVWLARQTGLSAKHVNQIVKGHVALSVPVALSLEAATGLVAEAWILADTMARVQAERARRAEQ